MKSLATALACVAVLALTGLSLAAEKKADAKTNKDLIVGVWEVTKSDSGAPAGATIEFTKDGKMIVTIKDGDKTEKVDGTYTIDKDSITSKLKVGDKEKEETVKIKKLDDKVLVVEDKEGKKDEFKKK
jgi:uncharacterized protein (TIGR03066 family)